MLLFNHGFYDVFGNPESVVHSDGQSVYYGYDNLGRRTSVETQINSVTQTEASYLYDDMNRVTTVTDEIASQTTTFAYNPLGQLTSITRPNNVTSTYTYGDNGKIDPLGFLEQGIDVDGNIYTQWENPYQVYELNHTHSTNGLISEFDYTYDWTGNRKTEEITLPGSNPITTEYFYDDAYRLERETQQLSTGAEVHTDYQYDRAGNRTRMIDGDDVTAYSYNANDELTRVDYVNEYTHEEYEYDARGNLTTVTLNQNGVTPVPISTSFFAYNARDGLISADVPGSAPVTYAYDHRGNRVGQTIGTDTTDYLWDEFSRYGDVLLETTPTDTIAYTLAMGMLISQTKNGNTDYFLQDAQGSTVALADGGTGAVTSSYSYDAFGNVNETIDPADPDTTYLYTGQQFDPYTELYNLRARQYDPSVGRFLSRDTWAYNYQNPLELNRYVYTANNPATYFDPSGFNSEGYGASILGVLTSAPVIGAGIGGLIFFTGNFIYQIVTKGYVDPMELFLWTVTGALLGASLGYALAPLLAEAPMYSIFSYASVELVNQRILQIGAGILTYTLTVVGGNTLHNLFNENDEEDVAPLDGWNIHDMATNIAFSQILSVANSRVISENAETFERVFVYSLNGGLVGTAQGVGEAVLDGTNGDCPAPLIPSFSYMFTNTVSVMSEPLATMANVFGNTALGSIGGADSLVHESCQ